MTDLSSISHPNTINKTQSLFILPAIFTLMMIFCLTVSIIFLYFFKNDFELYGGIYDIGKLFYEIALDGGVSYFSIAVIMFIYHKMHQITLRNVLGLLVTCVIYCVLYYFIVQGLRYTYSFIDASTYYAYPFLFYIVYFIQIVLPVLVLVALLKIFFSIYRCDRQTYQLPNSCQNNLLAFLFALIVSFPTMIILPIIKYQLYYRVGFSTSLWRFIEMIIILITVVFYFFSARGCFDRKMNEIPLKLLFKSAGWTYLYLLIFNFVLGLAQMLVSMMMLASVDSYSYSQMQSMSALVLIISIVFCIIGLVGTVKLIRKAVRKYFSEQ